MKVVLWLGVPTTGVTMLKCCSVRKVESHCYRKNWAMTGESWYIRALHFPSIISKTSSSSVSSPTVGQQTWQKWLRGGRIYCSLQLQGTQFILAGKPQQQEQEAPGAQPGSSSSTAFSSICGPGSKPREWCPPHQVRVISSQWPNQDSPSQAWPEVRLLGNSSSCQADNKYCINDHSEMDRKIRSVHFKVICLQNYRRIEVLVIVTQTETAQTSVNKPQLCNHETECHGDTCHNVSLWLFSVTEGSQDR